jgi:hypothetical protein
LISCRASGWRDYLHNSVPAHAQIAALRYRFVALRAADTRQRPCPGIGSAAAFLASGPRRELTNRAN